MFVIKHPSKGYLCDLDFGGWDYHDEMYEFTVRFQSMPDAEFNLNNDEVVIEIKDETNEEGELNG